MTRTARTLLAGLALAGAYLAVALATLTPLRPLRPFFDADHTRGAYRFVTPPTPDPANLQPLGAEVDIAFVERTLDGERRRVLEGGAITTQDGQATISVPSGVIPPAPEQTAVHFSITPLDPAAIGEPPEGTVYDGNAISIEGTYVPSGDPVTFTEQDCSLGGCLSVILTYAHAGTELWIRDPDAWREVETAQNNPSAFSMLAPTLEIGTFVVTKPPTIEPGPNLTRIAAFAGGGLAVGASLLYSWRRRRAAEARAQAARRGRGGKRASSTKTAGRPSRGSSGKSSRGNRATHRKPRR